MSAIAWAVSYCGKRGLAVDLRQLRMVDHAFGDAVLAAEAELVRFGQELVVALDAGRLGDEMLGAPVVGDAAAVLRLHECGSFQPV